MSNVLERFLNYVKFDTTSDPNSNLHPSTSNQFKLLEQLEKEMKEIGLINIQKSDECYIYGLLPKTADGYKTIGFISHMDTSCDASGYDIKPQIFENYDGLDVLINKKENIIMHVNEFTYLKDLKGKKLITTDGTTLLGADDKAGIAEIFEAIDFLNKNKEIKHGDIYVAITPDEEIGEGTMFFDLSKFPCDFGYTMDGGPVGEINYENFNAASAKVTINGINIHPGSAKGHMINSILVAYEFNSMLDPNMVPSKTEKYEGFNHLNNMDGNVEKTEMHYIIRNHDKKLFEDQKESFKKIEKQLNEKYGYNICVTEIKDSYYNMYDLLKDKKEIIDIAINATKKAGIEPLISPIRGGTDGATLTYKGLPCPNLGTGGYGFHGRWECITEDDMEKAIEIILNIIQSVK